MSLAAVLVDRDRYRLALERCTLSIVEHGNGLLEIWDWKRTPCAS